MVKQDLFPLLPTSLLKMHDIPLFPGGASELPAIFQTFLNYWKNQTADELLNMIFENSLPKGYFW